MRDRLLLLAALLAAGHATSLAQAPFVQVRTAAQFVGACPPNAVGVASDTGERFRCVASAWRAEDLPVCSPDPPSGVCVGDELCQSKTDGSSSRLAIFGCLAGTWNAIAGGGGGSSTFAGLTDTSIVAPAAGQVSIYDGVDTWDNRTVTGDATLAASGALTIAPNAVALAADTSGNYVQSVATVAPLAGGAAGTEGADLTLSVSDATTGAKGVVQLAGDLAGTAASPAIAPNAVALGTDTTGDYVAGATASQGLVATGTEAATLGLIDCAANEVVKRNATDTAWICAPDDTGTDTLDDLSDDALADLGDVVCTAPASGTPLEWNGTAWDCGTDDGGGGGGVATVKESGATLTGAATTMDFGAGFDLTESPVGEVNVVLDLTEDPVDLATEVTGALPDANVVDALTVSGTGSSVYPEILRFPNGAGAAGSQTVGQAIWDYTGQVLHVGTGTEIASLWAAAGANLDDRLTVGFGTGVAAVPLPASCAGATQKLVYDGASNQFSCGADDTGNDTLDDLSDDVIADLGDVTQTIAADGHVLIFQATGATWENKAIGGDVALAPTGTATIQPNSVALGTDTTGNYAASASEGGPASDVSCASCVSLGGETVGVYVASATASQGLLVTGSADAVSMGLQDCAAGQVLKRNVGDTAWECAADDTGGAANTFETIDAPAGTDPVADSSTDTLTLAATAPVTVTGDSATDTLTIAVADATTVAKGVIQLAGDLAGTAASPAIAANSVALGTDTTGNYAAGDAEAGAATGVACTDCVSLGVETAGNYVASATASQGLALTGTEGASLGLQDCAASQILKRDALDTAWECAADGGGAASGGSANSLNVADGAGGWTALGVTVTDSGSTTVFDSGTDALEFQADSAIRQITGSYFYVEGLQGIQMTNSGANPTWWTAPSVSSNYNTGAGETTEMLQGAERKQWRFDPFDYEDFPSAGGDADTYGGGFDIFCDANATAFEIQSCEFSGVWPTGNMTYVARDVRLGSAARPWTQAWITSWLANLDGDGDFEAVFQPSATGADDQVLVGAGQGQYAGKTLPDCDNATTSKLLYDQATNAFSCGTDQAGGAANREIWTPTLLDPSDTTDLQTCDGANATCLVGPRLGAATTLASIHCFIDPANSGESASVTLYECSFGPWSCSALHAGTVSPGHTPTAVTLTDTSLAAGNVLALDVNSAATTINQLVCTFVGN